MDFNVSPMTATLSHIIRNKDGVPEVHVFHGYYVTHSNTSAIAERILVEFPNTQTFYVSPCQSSSNHQTVAEAGLTDLRIIRNIFSNRGKGIIVSKHSKNPQVKDRINAVNSMLFTKRIRINPEVQALRELMKDFEQISWKEGSADIDSSDTARKHISDAFGYFVEYFFPITSGMSKDTGGTIL
jgi:hypothetical protein